MILDKINSPKDLKVLKLGELETLASEIREILLKKLSVTGGHFGPNFGIVEATIALHYVFNTPQDKLIFDVSHQSYIHKILTGRKSGFVNPERYNSITGYANPSENGYDYFSMGHTSTSISLACGMAKARDLVGRKENIVAIIGDGSLSGGEAYEGLDFANELHSNFIVVVNDNNQAIADNHGGLYPHLAELRNSNGKSQNNFFKTLGFDYLYVDKGNNIQALIDAFNSVKDTKHPVVVHINTLKGKGYSYAENEKEKWHYTRPFNVDDGTPKQQLGGEHYDRITRDFLISKMKQDPTIVAIVAATPSFLTLNTKEQRESLGKQFVDVGIAEEHAVAMSAGIAKNGGKPIFCTNATFFQRTYDQISQELCINNSPATLLVRNASIWAENDVNFLGIFDIPMISNIPNIVYLAPTNCEEYVAMLDWSLEQQEHPVAIRIPRNGVVHSETENNFDYSNINTSLLAKIGSKVAIMALGDFFQLGESIARSVEEQLGFQPTLINPIYISGLDESLLESMKNEHKIVVTLEDGILDGGYGQKVASFYSASSMKVYNFGFKKKFLNKYNASDVLKDNGITIENIIKVISDSL